MDVGLYTHKPMIPSTIRTGLVGDVEGGVEHTDTVIGGQRDAPKVNVAWALRKTPDEPIDWVKVVNDARLIGGMERFYERGPVYVMPTANDRYALFQFMCF